MSPSAPAYVRYTVMLLAVALVVTFTWRGIRWTMHDARPVPVASGSTYAPSSAEAIAARSALWQHDFSDTLDGAARDAGAGNISSAEMAVDRAETMITASRLTPGSAAPNHDYFATALAKLDRVLQQHPDDQRLLEHVTLARISLAELRTTYDDTRGVSSRDDAPASGIVQITAPREISANQTLSPKTFGGSYLDATFMPDTSEILLPPFSRAFADNVRVENVTFSGAAQTLDGIHWRNVTFMGTRLRYEGGELDLQNVQFVRCRFGFTTDERGARLANAIVAAPDNSGITITIEAQPQQPQSP
jgi:hypothetical protein